MGSWLDAIGLDNPEPFFDLLGKHSQVRAVVWGHIHQAFDQRYHGIRLLGVPSTCAQFAPHTESFTQEMTPPGYRWLELFPDGRIETAIQRLLKEPPPAENREEPPPYPSV